MGVTLGLEKLLQMGPGAVGRRRTGLITNHTGVDSLVRQNVELLREAGFDLVALFGPEHGIRGSAQDCILVDDDTDPWSGLPAFSLFGEHRKPTPQMLAGVEALVFDIQDIGARFYTYTYTMAYGMQAAKEAGIPFYVLDRPNPVGGVALEGSILQPGFESFIGLYPLPTRHGMTAGELALLFNTEFGIGCNLAVIACTGWQRQMYWEETGLPFVPLSPNAPSMEMAVVYTGTCLFEGANWSEGRGTTKPFEQVGAPWADGKRWADHLNGLGLPGVRFRPVFFTPTFARHAGTECQGVQVHVTDRSAFLPVLTGLLMLESAFRLWPAESSFSTGTHEGIQLSHLCGTDAVQKAIEAGRPVRDLYDSWAPGLAAFAAQRQQYLLY